MPIASSADATTAVARDLIQALLHPTPASPLSPTGNSQHAALHQLAEIFPQATTPTPPILTDATPVPTVPAIPRVPTGFAPLATTQPVFAATDTAPPPTDAVPAQLPRVDPIVHPPVAPTSRVKAPSNPQSTTYASRTSVASASQHAKPSQQPAH